MPALTIVLLLAALVLVLATSGVLVGPAAPRSGPEAWVRCGPRTPPPPQGG